MQILMVSNVNRLNIPIKRQTLSKWIKKQDPTTVDFHKTANQTVKRNSFNTETHMGGK